jgi:uncharacterized protein
MAVDHIRYDLLTQDALRGVVRAVLLDVAKNGLPGEHHFYISFDTRAEGVHLSARMLEQYPKEMTVVLQHQFWDLRVTDSGFEVGLSFGGIAERLAVPFAAIKGFFDPSVQFGLQFEEIGETESQDNRDTDKEAKAGTAQAKPPAAVTPGPAPASPETVSDPNAKSPAPGAEVVRLDRFRKK